MNYISEINEFYDWLETNQLPKSAIALWNALMHIGNKARWQTNFAVAISTIESKTGFKRSELFKARNILEQKGRIKWSQRGGNLSAEYQMIPFSVHIADAKAYANGNTVRTQMVTQMDTINKQNKTKQNKTVSGASPPVEKKETATKHWKPLKQIWISFYKQKFSLDPTFTGAAAKNFKQIIERIEKISKEKGFEWTEEYASRCLTHFLSKAYEDNWLRANFLLTNLNSKFDVIVNPKNNGDSKKNGQSTGGNVDLQSAFSKIDSMPG